MSNNVEQYATIFDAFGCQMRYNSSDGSISVVDTPKGTKTLIDRVLGEIKHFDNTKNNTDGIALWCVVDYIDNDPNPIDAEARANTLQRLGLTQDGKYIQQVLMLQKNNRSWHFSEKENECSYFGEECTHRGINPNPERKGKRSTRKPNEYHQLDGRNQIRREQLVTSALEEMTRSIPSDNLISAKPVIGLDRFDILAFKRLPQDQQLEFIENLKETVNG